jgi:membrane protease YdiL (CAAX protease family)
MIEEISMHSSKLSTPWVFLAITYSVSWVFWIPAGLFGRGVDTFPAALLFYLGGLGPPIAGIILTYLTKDQEGRRNYWQRLIQFKRISADWYFVILLTIPVMFILAILVESLLTGSGIQVENITRFLTQPLTIFPFVAFTLLFGPLPEELGWRGYLLDSLQVKRGALTSSLILGTAWSLWHLPLFFLQGTHQNSLGLGTPAFWLFMTAMLPESILMTWIYNNNQRSTLSAVLFHTMINLTGELLAVTQRTATYQVLLLTVTAITVTAMWGAKTLTHGKADSETARKTARV